MSHSRGRNGDTESESLLSPGPPAFDDSLNSGNGDDDLLSFPPVPSSLQERAPNYSHGPPSSSQTLQTNAQPYNDVVVNGGLGEDDDLLQLDDAVAIPSSNSGNGYAEVNPDPIYDEIGPATSSLSLGNSNDTGSSWGANTQTDRPNESFGYLEVDGTVAGQTGTGSNLLPAIRAGGIHAGGSSTVAVAGVETENANEDFSRPVTFVGGQLPDDFLTLMVKTEVPFDSPAEYNRNSARGNAQNNFPESGVLTVYLDEARLARNYGFGSMDPYVRLSVGSNRGCSQVCVNGAKNPFWSRSVTVNIPNIQDFSLRVEVLSQGTFSDRLVGWTEIPIIEAYQGEKIEGWHTLTGKQGKDKEGKINLSITFKRTDFLYQPVPGIRNGYALQPAPAPSFDPRFQQYQAPFPQAAPPYNYPVPGIPVPHYTPYGYGPPLHPTPAHQPSQAHPDVANTQLPPSAASQETPTNAARSEHQPVNHEAVQQLKDMFPVFDNSIIIGVLEGTQGNVEEAIESLLAMS